MSLSQGKTSAFQKWTVQKCQAKGKDAETQGLEDLSNKIETMIMGEKQSKKQSLVKKKIEDSADEDDDISESKSLQQIETANMQRSKARMYADDFDKFDRGMRDD